jgi:hypothetical protein
MKKFVSILISLALVLSFASIGLFATEPDGQTTVEYSIDPSYTVVIPATVAAGENLTITATSMNAEPGRRVVVTIATGISETSSILLIRQNASGFSEEPNQDNSNVLTAYVVLNTGTVDTSRHIAEFYDNNTTNQIGYPLEIGTPSTEGKLAGTYKGMLTFAIDYEYTNPK